MKVAPWLEQMRDDNPPPALPTYAFTVTHMEGGSWDDLNEYELSWAVCELTDRIATEKNFLNYDRSPEVANVIAKSIERQTADLEAARAALARKYDATRT